MDASALGNMIRARRLDLGLTLRQVSQKAGISHAMLGHVESGLRRPGADVLRRVFAALELDLLVEDLVVSEPTGTRRPDRKAIVDRFAKIADVVPDDQMDVFLHQLALWEKNYGRRSASRSASNTD